MMTPDQLLAAASYLLRNEPACTLVKNQVGNLTVMVGDEYAGFVDLNTGEVELFGYGEDD